MNKEDKERAIGKVVAINSDRFTIELLSGIDNFNVNGYDDIHYFAQLNSYVVIPYQNYYIVSEVAGVREKDLNVSFSNPTEQILNKVKAGKYLEVLPIGTLKINENDGVKFDFGVSVYPALYTDTLYIKETELDAIFNIKSKQIIVCSKTKACRTECKCTNTRCTTLPIGKSTIFPDYDVKIDIDKFFGSHNAVLGNTGSGKSCTISSILQELFYNCKNYSANGSTFIFYDVNGEYQQAFSKISDNNADITVKNFSINKKSDEGEDVKNFFLPHWFLNIDEWALLLQASEKTQLPILRTTLGIATLFDDDTDVEVLKNHILATCITQILRDDSSSPSKKDRITSILQKFCTNEIYLDKKFTYLNDKGVLVGKLLADRNEFDCTIRNCLHVHYGGLIGITALLNYLEQKDDDGVSIFLTDNFKMPSYDGPTKFSISFLEDALDLSLLYEEAHGNKQIRDYCSSLITRVKSIQDRNDFAFLKRDRADFEDYKRDILGLAKVKDSQNVIKKVQILIVNLSNVEYEIVEIVSCVLSRIIYDAVKEIPPRNSFPVNLVLEEAHRYLSEDTGRSFLRANKIFEQIAKEGRKFGVFLLISSQRPSELSRTVLSQCSNFIVHRIQNPEDLSHIRQITPHISEAVLKRMPSIPTQHALIFGHAVNLPTMFKVNDANPRPKSDNNEVSKNWFVRPEKTVYRIVD